MSVRVRSSRSALALLVAGAAIAAMAGLRERGLARADAARARDEHAGVVSEARRLLRSRGEGALVADRPRAESDLVGRVHAALHAAGIDPSALTQVSSTDARPIGSPTGGAARTARLLRQQSTLTIDAVQPGDLGRFVDMWRRDEPLWVVRSIRLDHAGRQTAPGPAPPGGEQNRFTAVLTLENVFLAENNPRTARAGGSP